MSHCCVYINDYLHGESKQWHENGQMCEHCFSSNGLLHGEYKTWNKNGTLINHCFYINDCKFSFDEIPYPKTEEDRMYFKLKYDIPLLDHV